jgi:hypothetical protein
MPEIDFHPTLATWSANKTSRPRTEGRTTIVKPIYRPTTQAGLIQSSSSSSNLRPPPIKHNSWSNLVSSAKESRRGDALARQSPLIDARGLVTRGSNLSRRNSKLIGNEYPFSIPISSKGRYPPDRTPLTSGESLFHSTKELHSSGGNGSQAKAVAYELLLNFLVYSNRVCNPDTGS